MKAQQDAKYTQETLERAPVMIKNFLWVHVCACSTCLGSQSAENKDGILNLTKIHFNIILLELDH